MKVWSTFWNPPHTDEGERLLLIRVLTLSLVLHAVTAWFSIGYQSADEQFQILEFLAHKLGWAPAGDMPVEFHAKMRPWLQPAIYYGMTRFWETLGITDSHFWAYTFRCFSSLIGWLSGAAMALCARDWFTGTRARRLVIWSSGLLWFMPALHARPSSESLAGSAFTIGVCLLTWAHQRNLVGNFKGKTAALWLAGGAFWGLAFEARYQLALMSVGGWLWFAFYSRSRGLARARELSLILLGFGVIFAIGRVADRWGFGDWSFSPWNYVDWNLLRGNVSKFGQEPWWEIFRVSVMESWPVLGLLFTLLVITAWVRHPMHVFTWCHIPFFIVHQMIQHKEYRFYYPIGSAGPVMITLALSKAGELDSWLIAPLGRVGTFLRRGIVTSIVVINVIAITALAFIPFARTVQFHQAVYREFRAQAPGSENTNGAREFELYTSGRDPFRILGNPIYFYRPAGLVVKTYASPDELVSRIQSQLAQLGRRLPVWIFEPSYELPSDLRSRLPECTAIFRTLPNGLSQLRETRIGSQVMARVNVFTLYRCVPSR